MFRRVFTLLWIDENLKETYEIGLNCWMVAAGPVAGAAKIGEPPKKARRADALCAFV